MFEFGFYEKEITPPLGCHIPGYFKMRRGSDVLDRLYARAAVVRSGEDTVAFISADGCGPGADTLSKEAGYIMAEKLVSMKKQFKNT